MVDPQKQGRYPRICLIVEGAYPYIVGGVGIWIHELISHLPEFEVVLWTIVPRRGLPHRFQLPENVVQVVEVALSDKLRSGPRRRGLQKQWQAIHDFHCLAENDHFPEFESLYRHVAPEDGLDISPANLFHDEEGWRLITQLYDLNHPISKFVDYYWAWRATHIPLFQMLQAPIPEADVYHAVSTGYAGLLGATAKLARQRPFLLTEHGIYARERELEINQSDLYLGYQKRMWKKNFYGLAKVAYRYADRIIALYRRNQNIQIELGAPPHKCELIPNGIRISDYRSLRRKSHAGFNVGFVGRMVPIKDVKTFIMAARLIHEDLPQSHFYLIGPTDEQDSYFRELQMLADNLDLGDVVTFTGKVDVREYLPILDVVCLTSVKEAQPLSLIEAMVAGVPVAATRVGDVEEMVGEYGVLVPPKSPDALAAGVLRLAQDSEFRRRCVAGARDHAVRTYDLDALIRRYRDMYEHYCNREQREWPA